jgi:hypothetical protein
VKIYYGNYAFPDRGTHWLYAEREVSTNGVPYARVITVVCEGSILADGEAAVASAIGAMRNACRIPGQTLRLTSSDTGTTYEMLSSSTALIPVRAVAGPTFTGRKPNEYVNYREFSVGFEGTYKPTSGPFAGNGVIVIENVRSITVEGGGPSVVWMPSVNGPSQKQSPEPMLPETLTESGVVVSRNLPYPIPAALIRPSAYVKALSKVGLTQRLTPTGVEYTRMWNYVYQDTRPF